MKYLFLILSFLLLVPSQSFAATKPVPVKIPDSFVGAAFNTRTHTYVLLDETGDVLAGKNTYEVRSIASLTKLMTAMVLLDEGVDFEKNVAYNPKLHYAYRNYMNFATGDVVNNRDSWHALLVGSMNIPARMLVNSLGLSDAEFVAKMNAKAEVLGLQHTHFADVSGLDPDNVSTSYEVGHLLMAALKYPEIKEALSTNYYAFDEIDSNNAQVHHQFAHTNTLLPKKNLPFTILASKTGYIDEAGPCIALSIESKDGVSYVLVNLGEADYARKFTEIPKFFTWFSALPHRGGLAIHW